MRVGFETDGVRAQGTVASTLVPGEDVRRRAKLDGLTAQQALDLPVERGRTYEFSKFVGVDTSPEHASAAVRYSRGAADRGWEELFAAHVEQWKRLWHSDIRVHGRPELQDALRSSKYALLSSIREARTPASRPPGSAATTTPD